MYLALLMVVVGAIIVVAALCRKVCCPENVGGSYVSVMLEDSVGGVAQQAYGGSVSVPVTDVGSGGSGSGAPKHEDKLLKKEPMMVYPRREKEPKKVRKGTQDGPKGAQEGLKGAQEGRKGTQEGQKNGNYEPQESPGGAQEGQKKEAYGGQESPEGTIRCSSSGHRAGGCVTFVEVSKV